MHVTLHHVISQRIRCHLQRANWASIFGKVSQNIQKIQKTMTVVGNI